MSKQFDLPSLSRRKAIKWCLGLPPLLNLVPAAAAAWGGTVEVVGAALLTAPSLLVLHDPHDALALDMARAARRAGVETLAVAGDVTAIWQQHLRAFWHKPGAVLVGVTRADALFCLDLLARDAGQRLRYQAPVGNRIPEELWSPDIRQHAPTHGPLSGEDARQHAWLITI